MELPSTTQHRESALVAISTLKLGRIKENAHCPLTFACFSPEVLDRGSDTAITAQSRPPAGVLSRGAEWAIRMGHSVILIANNDLNHRKDSDHAQRGEAQH